MSSEKGAVPFLVFALQSIKLDLKRDLSPFSRASPLLSH